MSTSGVVPNAQRWPLTKQQTIELICLLLYGAAMLLVLRGLAPVMPNLDNGIFMPVSYYHANSGELMPYWHDTLNMGVFNWHGFVHPTFMSWAAPGSSWGALQQGTNILAFLAFTLSIVTAFVARIPVCARIVVALVACSLLLDFRARPETTALIVLLVMMLWHMAVPSFGKRPILSGLVSGGLFAALMYSHPASFLICAPLYGVYCAYRLHQQTDVVVRIAFFVVLWAAGYGLMSLFLQAVMYPDTLPVWYAGIFNLGATLSEHEYEESFWLYYVFLRNLPLFVLYWGFFVLVMAHAFRKLVYPGARNWAWRGIALFCGGAGLYMAYRLAIPLPSKYYNLTPLVIPAMIACAAIYFSPDYVRGQSDGTALLDRLAAWLKSAKFNLESVRNFVTLTADQAKSWSVSKSVLFTLFAIVAGLSVLTQAVWVAQWTVEVDKVGHYHDLLQKRLVTLLDAGLHVCSDASGMAASPDFDTSLKIDMSDPWSKEELYPDNTVCDVYVRVQAQRKYPVPNTFEGFHLIENQYVAPDRFFLPNVRPLHLAFALYASDVTTKALPTLD